MQQKAVLRRLNRMTMTWVKHMARENDIEVSRAARGLIYLVERGLIECSADTVAMLRIIAGKFPMLDVNSVVEATKTPHLGENLFGQYTVKPGMTGRVVGRWDGTGHYLIKFDGIPCTVIVMDSEIKEKEGGLAA